MLSRAVSSTRNRASLLVPLTAAASICAVIVSHRKDDHVDSSMIRMVKESLPPFKDRWSAFLPNSTFSLPRNKCSCESLSPSLSRRSTLNLLDKSSTKSTVESRYLIDWKHPLGEGGFGAVYKCVDRATGETYALKKMPKKYTDNASFLREIVALLTMSESGAHPNICGLHEHFDENENYYLILDLISGGEMFDHLCQNGAYSEADAAHLVRETASALAFIHGVGLVHADLKPENLMLTTKNKMDSVIKLVDFGCAEMYKGNTQKQNMTRKTIANTPAYSPPEAFSSWKGSIQPSFDMFGMGVVLYIMLTGCHPFDLTGRSTNEQIERRIKTENAPLRNNRTTAHLSESAIDLMEKLLVKNPQKRMTAMQMLEHPWVQGLTAEKRKITGSDTKLSRFRKFKSRLEVKIFADWVSGATDDDADNKSGLVERQFKKLDTHKKGYITEHDFGESLTGRDEKSSDAAPLSLSEFTDLISDNMMNKYYPEGYEIYKEGSKGDTIYFINSGTVEIATKAGYNTTLSQGQLFGEGALLLSTGLRNASVKCVTPVHVVAISKEYFTKYMSECGSDTNLNLQELHRSRDKEQALQLLSNHKKLATRDVSKGDVLFSYGEDGKSLFIVDEGKVEITAENGKHVLYVTAGQICGEHSLIMKQPRNVTALCASDNCKVREMAAKHFNEIYDSSPSVKQSLREFCLRRDFQKAIVDKMGKDFGTTEDELRKVFDSVDADSSGEIEIKEVKGLIKRIYPFLKDDDPLFTEVLRSLDIDKSNSVKWDEFKKLFMNKKCTKATSPP